MSEISLDAACQLFDTEVPLQYQNRLKLQGTIEERHGLHGTSLNVPVSDLVEMNQTNFAPTDIFVTPVNETNVPVPTNDYHLKTVIGEGGFKYTVPVVHHDAIIQGYNRNITTSITWLPHQDRWELLTCLTSGAKIIQSRGIALITANQKFVPNT